MTKLAVIGTAGRKTDAAFLNLETYTRMVDGVVKLIDQLAIDPNELELISGGAAWADHIVVTLCQRGIVPYERLKLFLPAPLLYYGYDEGDDKHKKTSSTANYYHKQFSHSIGRNTIAELCDARKAGAVMDEESIGFHHRNGKVAKSLLPTDHVLAYTSGDPRSSQPLWTIYTFKENLDADKAGLKDGGTAHTWNLCKSRKHHGRVGLINDQQFPI